MLADMEGEGERLKYEICICGKEGGRHEACCADEGQNRRMECSLVRNKIRLSRALK